MRTELEARPVPTSSLVVLARREILNYLRSWPYLVGVALCLVLVVPDFLEALAGEDDGTSSTMTMMAPASTIGLLGLVVTARLTRRSDAAAAVAGAVAVGESARTWALVCATVVPGLTSLGFFGLFVIEYVAVPPSAAAVPFGPVGDAHVLTVMFALVVPPGVGGPLLGILTARWLRFTGATALVVVLLVLVTIVMQGNFEATWHWRVVWPWTYWYGPLGWSQVDGGETHWVALPGSPLAWIGYQAALCGLGITAALLHDREADRARLLRVGAGLLVAAVVLLVLTMTTGLGDAVSNPVPGLSF